MTPWGWTGPARGMLLLLAAAMGSMLARASGGGGLGPVPVPSPVIDPNTAPEAVLRTLPMIGPVLAGRIAEGRPYRSMGDLDRRVKGIGPATAAALTPYLRFERPDRASTPRP